MVVRIVLWSLADSKTSIGDVRREELELEATVEGRSASEQLSRLGPAFE